MVDYRKNSQDLLEYRHPQTGSFVPVVAPIEIQSGYLVKLISSQEAIINNILTELSALKVQQTNTSAVQLINTQETILQNIVLELENVIVAIQNQSGGGGSSTDVSTLEGLVSNILNSELPLIRNNISTINNKIPVSTFPVELIASQENLISNIVTILTAISSNLTAVGINTDDIYSILEELLTLHQGDTPTTDPTLYEVVTLIKSGVDNVFSAVDGGIDNGVILTEIKNLLPKTGVSNALTDLLTSIFNELETIKNNAQEVILSTTQEQHLFDVIDRLDQMLLVLDGVADGTGDTNTGENINLEPYLTRMENETNLFRNFPVELIQRQEATLNDIQAETTQVRRYLGRLVDPLGVDADGSQIAVSQDILDRLITIDNFIKSRFVSEPARIVNLTLINANTEYSFTLPASTKRFAVKARSNNDEPSAPFRFAYVAGIVASGVATIDDGFDTIYPESEESDRDVNFSTPVNIYFASSTANLPIVIKYWR